MRSWPVLLAVMLVLVPPQPALVEGGETGARADLGVYHTYDEMTAELENLTAAHPDILRLESIGKTYEGRELWAVKLSDNVTADEAEPNITILGGIHAGEIIGVEVALYILNSLVENYTTNSTIGWYVNSTQIWFVPMLNPDGHVYYEQGNQWRKNRRPNQGGTYGVDLNRNFGHLWGLEASHNPPDDEYCGPYAFSENETQAVSKLATDHHPLITLSYHSYGQYILYPWGNSINQEPVDPRLSQIAWNMSFAMPEGRRYMPMFAREMYAASGDTDDYFYMNLSILPFTIELATSNRPLDSAVAGICADNYGPVLYVLNYTVGAPPPPPPKRSLSIGGPATLHGSPGETVTADFTLRNTGEASEAVSISCASGSPGWSVSVRPGRADLDIGESVNLTVSAQVPADALAFQAVILKVEATSTGGAGATANITGMVDAVTSVESNLSSPAAFPVGEIVTLSLEVHNRGNAFENLTLSAVSYPAWYFTQIPGEFELRPRTVTNTFLRMRVPSFLEPGLLSLNVTVSVRNRDGTYQRNQSFALTVETRRDLRIEPDRSAVNLTEGQEKVVSVWITNHGNFRERGRLFLSNGSALTTLSKSYLDLPPGANETVYLTVRGEQAGKWNPGLRFVSDAGYPDVPARFNITVRSSSRPPPEPDFRPAIILAVVIVVLAVVAFVWWRSRRGNGGPGGNGAP